MSNATHHIYFREKAEIFCDEENTCSTLTMASGVLQAIISIPGWDW